MEYVSALAYGVTGVLATVAVLERKVLSSKLVRLLKKLERLFRKKQRKYAHLVVDRGDSTQIDAFFCPLTGEVMRDPVMTPHGLCFEKKAIKHYISQHGKCPLTGETLAKHELKTCFTMRDAIQEYLELQKTA